MPMASSCEVVGKNLRVAIMERPWLFLFMERSGQSGLGIASLALSIFSVIISIVLVVIAGVMEVSTPGGVDESSAAAVVVGLSILACLGLNLVSIGLGIAGIIQKQRTRICAFIGTALSSASFAVVVSIIAIGNAIDS